MIQSCSVCKNKYTTEYRNWYDRYIPWVCSSKCFRRFLLETEEHMEDLTGIDKRVSKFFSPWGLQLRSGYERLFRSWLIRQEIPHEYEPYSLTLESKKRYVPDYLIDSRIFVEVKGLWNSESKKKFIAMNREFYDLPIVVVDRGFLDMLRRTEKRGG